MWSWKIGSLFGIDLKIHATFPLALLYAAYQFAFSPAADENPWGYALYGAALVLILFVCVLLHELGHALTALRFKIPVSEIVLLPIGGLAKLKMVRDNPKEEFIIALAGPLVNLAITVLLIPVLLLWLVFLFPDVIGSWFSSGRVGWMYILNLCLRSIGDLSLLGALTYLILSNGMLVLFNLIPAFPMDGGRIFRAFLAWFLSYKTATVVAVRVGQAMAIVFGLLGFRAAPSLVLVAVFVFFSGYAELQRVQFRNVLEGGSITAFMRRGFTTLFPQWNLYSAQLLAQQTGQAAFPVVENGRLVGLLTLDQVNSVSTERTVSEVMSASYPVVAAQGTLYDAHIELALQEQYTAAVMDEGHLVGLISLDDIERGYLSLRPQKKALFA
jgi:Zn-dependent protease